MSIEFFVFFIWKLLFFAFIHIYRYIVVMRYSSCAFEKETMMFTTSVGFLHVRHSIQEVPWPFLLQLTLSHSNPLQCPHTHAPNHCQPHNMSWGEINTPPPIRQKDAWLLFLETGHSLEAKTREKKRMNNNRRRQSLPTRRGEGKTLLIFLVLSNHFVPSRRKCDTEERERN